MNLKIIKRDEGVMKQMNVILSVLSLFSLGLCTGCVRFFPEPGRPAKQLVLSPEFKVLYEVPQVSWNLKIEKPFSSDGLKTSRISVLRQQEGLSIKETLAGIEWEQPLPDMIQRYLLDAFIASGKIRGVGRSRDHFRALYTLQLDIRHFDVELREDTSPRVSLEMIARLVSFPGGTVQNQKVFKSFSPTPSPTLPEIRQAFEQALSTLLNEIVIWTLEN